MLSSYSQTKKGEEKEETRRGRLFGRGASLRHQDLRKVFPRCSATRSEEETPHHRAAERTSTESLADHR